ncbi:DUF3473 domain-containing protein [bacterium]|nr:DUF3473 domain-containing protein [bacterium]
MSDSVSQFDTDQSHENGAADSIPPADHSDGALGIDVEEWFCAHNLSPPLLRRDWPRCESRVEASVMRLLDMMEKTENRATFFLLGWVMERHPDLASEILSRGHEVATHGYDHRPLTTMTADEFERDLESALNLHVRQHSQPVIGYRAPSFTLVTETLWAIPILERYGIHYSSSVFPVKGHPTYGIPDAPLSCWKIGDTLMELPLTVAERVSLRIPCAGGAYMRLLPFSMIRSLLRQVRKDGRPLNLYLHPWEIDSDQPRVTLPFSKAYRHYHNLDKTEQRLQLLLEEFRFTPLKEQPCLQ